MQQHTQSSATAPNRHLYLFTLEVAPLRVGHVYNPLPSHLTLMSRFWSELTPEELTKIVAPLFEQTKPIELHFGIPATLGPKQVPVHLIENTGEIKALHSELRALLDDTKVAYTASEYIGEEVISLT